MNRNKKNKNNRFYDNFFVIIEIKLLKVIVFIIIFILGIEIPIFYK